MKSFPLVLQEVGTRVTPLCFVGGSTKEERNARSVVSAAYRVDTG